MQEAESQIDEQAARRNVRRLLLIMTPVIVLGATIGALASGGSSINRHHRHHHHSALGVALQLAGGVLVLVVVGAVVYRMLTRQRYGAVMQYSWKQRRRASKSLTKGVPVAEGDWPVVEAIRTANRLTGWRLLIFPAVFLFELVNLFHQHGIARWFWAGLAVVFLLLAPLLVWQQRRNERNYQRLRHDRESALRSQSGV